MALKTWNGTTGTWSTAGNWAPSGVPADGDDVVIPDSGSAYTLTLDVSTTLLDSLTIGDPGAGTGLITFDLGAFTLNVTGVGGGATDTISLAQLGGTLITLAGGTINATTLQAAVANQTVSGFGSLAITGSTTAGVTLTASGGTLEVEGTVDAGAVLTIDTAAGSTLAILGTATSSGAIAINNGNQKLEIGPAASLTINAAESITGGAIQLDATTSTLTAAAGLTIGAGAALSGQGTVATPTLSGTGTITASGTLTLTQSLSTAANTIGFQIASLSELQINGQVSTGNTFAFVNNAGFSGLVGIGDDTGMDATFDDMFVATGVTPTEAVDIEGHTVSIVSVTGQGTTSGTITLSDGAVLHLTNLTSTAWFANTQTDGATGTFVFVSDTPCYCPGTLILTDRGDVAVEQLAIGDRVVTLSGEPKPIIWIGHRAYSGRFVGGNRNILPIRIVADALGDGIPARDLLVSPEHSLYIDGMLAPARLLVNGTTIVQEERAERLEYFHVELAEHDIIFAEGAPAESYTDCDNRGMFRNASEFAALFPGDERPRWQFCAPRLEPDWPELASIRAGMLWRAEALDLISDDPDFHLIVDGEVVRAQSVSDWVYTFKIPASRGPICLASRSVVPAETESSSSDARRIGVPVRRIILDEAGLRTEIGCGHSCLREGLHQSEGGHRWTDGMARLPEELLRPFAGEITIEVHLMETGVRYPVGLPGPSPQQRRKGRAAKAARQSRRAS